jgi:hypothetical protein
MVLTPVTFLEALFGRSVSVEVLTPIAPVVHPFFENPFLFGAVSKPIAK